MKVATPAIVHITPVNVPIYSDGKLKEKSIDRLIQIYRTYKVATTACEPATIVERARQLMTKAGIITLVVENIHTIHDTIFKIHETVCAIEMFNSFCFRSKTILFNQTVEYFSILLRSARNPNRNP